MHKMLLFVIAEHMLSDYPFCLRIKMREEVRIAEQTPVKEQNIVDLHDIKHCNESAEESPEAEIILHSIPNAQNKSARKQKKRNRDYCPANDMRTAASLRLLSGITARTSLCAEPKNLLS